jgi:hypothetical protein
VTSHPSGKIGRGFQPIEIPGLSIIHLKAESGVERSKTAQEINVYTNSRLHACRISTWKRKNYCCKCCKACLTGHVYRCISPSSGSNPTSLATSRPHFHKLSTKPTRKILFKSSNSGEAKKLLYIIVAATQPLTVANDPVDAFMQS